MKAKQRLSNYYDLTMELDQITRRISELRERSCSLKSSSNFSNIHGSNGTDKIATIISNITYLEDMHYCKVNEIMQEQKVIEDMIADLTPRERFIIRCRYIEGNTWENVAQITGFCERHVHRIHGMSLYKIDKNNK